MKLKDAVTLYKQEEDTLSNAYNGYVTAAKKYGSVSIGGVSISTYKEKGAWCIDENEFSFAITKHRDMIERIKQNTNDLSQGVIHGKDGDTIYIKGGGYRIEKNFRFVWLDILVERQKSYGSWYCNDCNVIANTEHSKEECHICRDWNGCGRDCTLSGVSCPKCHKSINI